jgi:hypothetical protein
MALEYHNTIMYEYAVRHLVRALIGAVTVILDPVCLLKPIFIRQADL